MEGDWKTKEAQTKSYCCCWEYSLQNLKKTTFVAFQWQNFKNIPHQICPKSRLEFVKNNWIVMWMSHIWSFQDEDHFNCLWKQNIKRFCLKEHYHEWTSEFDMQMRLLHFFHSTAFSNMQRSNEFRRLIGIHFKHQIAFFLWRSAYLYCLIIPAWKQKR